MNPYYWDVQNRTRQGQYLTSVEDEFLTSCLKDKTSTRRILDVGGGSGRFAIPTDKKGFKVVVSEVNPLPLSWLKVRSPLTDAILVSPNISRWPVGTSTFDCVTAIEVPIVEKSWFWQECYRILKQDGFVIATTLNRASIKGILYRLKASLDLVQSRGEERWEGARFYTQSFSGMEKLFEQNGFKLERAIGFNWLPTSRSSEVASIPLLAEIEGKLGLRKLVSLSPWVIFKAKILPGWARLGIPQPEFLTY